MKQQQQQQKWRKQRQNEQGKNQNNDLNQWRKGGRRPKSLTPLTFVVATTTAFLASSPSSLGTFVSSFSTLQAPLSVSLSSSSRIYHGMQRKNVLGIITDDDAFYSSIHKKQRLDCAVLFASRADDEGEGDANDGVTTTRQFTLAELEDMEERRLDQLEESIKNSSNNGMKQSSEKIDERVLAQRRDQMEKSRYDAMFVEEDAERLERQKRIDQILEEDDKKWREERRQKKLGKYANVKSKDDLKKLEEEERETSSRDNERKAAVAREAGVTLTVLEATEFENLSEKSNFEPINVQASGPQKRSWFKELDEELNNEIDNMMNEGDGIAAVSVTGDDDDSANTGGPRVINGKVVSQEDMQGIRVGSAGGWSLEVFPGDFVVHRKYGIGRFDKTVLKSRTKLSEEEQEARDKRREEIVRELMAARNTTEEIQSVVSKFGTDDDNDPISNPLSTLLEIAYNDAIVHVPVDRAYRLSRYRAGDAAIKPRLSRVKGEAWSKAKNKVEVNTLQMAQDVLALYATRETLKRSPFDPSVEGKVKAFGETFGYEPTPDQYKCFEAVENDMVWRTRPMDRLVCGDVGFGKTEVALRALFRCVANGRQAALLAPTGVLAAQHTKNVLQRMGEESGFDYNIAVLRGGMGKNTKAGRQLREEIASGKVDLVVGTHALLSKGLQFKDLGLLVVDEEQRFGVKQKERLKLICNGVDVLTLTATPIPRTLQMSLSGIRDTSTIRSPPPMRKPTLSIVQEYNEDVVKHAIELELQRGGQCYYVVPRIAQLDEAEAMISKLFPDGDVRVIQAHGRMARGAAEENVASFAEGNYDILLATTVIENGVDIPSVNTILIQNAQAFGMSTLYQLRGRVGRSSLQGFAYFLHKEEAITEQSAMRLQAMADLHELGSGFDVANRDLEIRGAGSLLGTEQSGMAAKVGFDLYMRMLKKSIRQLRGLDLPMVPRTNVLLPDGEGSIEVSAGPDDTDNAFKIPKSYIPDHEERLKEEGAARLAESTTQLVDLTNLWKETYGPLPSSLQSKLKTLHLHACTRQLGIDLVGLDDMGDGQLDCVLRSPGLRLRHWANICKSLPRGVPTKGLDVVFPARFSVTREEFEIKGGKKINLEALAARSNFGDDDDEEWDALDQEEVEAMKEISSAVNVKNLEEVDLEQYPRFVIKNLGAVKVGSRVDILLKALLPASKVVYENQQSDKEKARVAAELREKREMMKKVKKENDAVARRRLGSLD
mmetsp:Transcript_8516/g.12477  ORF Transcript_8516/g.12477 Transcript_8516/m.12477 type:complete len:1228 (-) Transcript_8516:444-4127(-)